MLKEHDIRPEELEKICEGLMEADRRNYSSRPRLSVDCVACGGSEVEDSFVKFGDEYRRCARCSTLYLSPRLSQADLNHFFKNSSAMKFWAEKIFQSSIEARRGIMAERVGWLKAALFDGGTDGKLDSLIEIGPGYGLFLEEAKKAGFATKLACIEPSAECCDRIRSIGVASEVFQCALDEVKTNEKYDLVVLNGVVEHSFSLMEFFGHVRALLNRNGRVAVFSPGSDGVDSRVLRELSSNTEPPQMQNFLSKKGLLELARRTGFGVAHFESVGALDADLLRKAFAANPTALLARFSRILDIEAFQADFQNLLKKHQITGFYFTILRQEPASDAS